MCSFCDESFDDNKIFYLANSSNVYSNCYIMAFISNGNLHINTSGISTNISLSYCPMCGSIINRCRINKEETQNETNTVKVTEYSTNNPPF